MTFLELCQRLVSESGTTGTGPTSVLNQVGEYARIVNWVHSAYEDVQNAYQDWRFLTTDVEFPTVADTQAYTPTEAGYTDLAKWKTANYGDFRAYTAFGNEQYLDYLPWSVFRTAYLFGSSRTQTGKPIVYSVKPDNSIIFYPIPDAGYTISGEYYKVPDVMTVNTSVPIIPARFQLVIVWRALMLYGAFEAADEKYAHGQNEYKKLFGKLKKDQGPTPSFGAPLA